MKCEQCGKEFRPSGRGKAQRYCSKHCRNRANYLARKHGDGSEDVKPAAKTKAKPRAKHDAPLKRLDFERLMDSPIEDVLRANRDRLQAAMYDIDTPASALPAISRQLIAVCRELASETGGDPLLDLNADVEEAVDDGASII